MQTFLEMEMDYFVNNSTDEHWIPVHPNAPVRYNYKMEYEEVEREDEYLQVG